MTREEQDNSKEDYTLIYAPSHAELLATDRECVTNLPMDATEEEKKKVVEHMLEHLGKLLSFSTL
jgi:hypothetical protein